MSVLYSRFPSIDTLFRYSKREERNGVFSLLLRRQRQCIIRLPNQFNSLHLPAQRRGGGPPFKTPHTFSSLFAHGWIAICALSFHLFDSTWIRYDSIGAKCQVEIKSENKRCSKWDQSHEWTSVQK